MYGELVIKPAIWTPFGWLRRLFVSRSTTSVTERQALDNLHLEIELLTKGYGELKYERDLPDTTSRQRIA